MANYANAKATIAANIYTNHLGQVTAEMVKTAANSIVDTLIAGGYLYAGIAKLTPTQTNPGSPDANVFYIATEPGTYTNFVGAGGSLVVADGEVAIFKFNGTWSKEVTGAATAAQVTELGQKLIKLVGIGSQTGGDSGVTQVDDVYYNVRQKQLRQCTVFRSSSDFDYIVVPFRDGAIYTYSGNLYIWSGTNLICLTNFVVSENPKTGGYNISVNDSVLNKFGFASQIELAAIRSFVNFKNRFSANYASTTGTSAIRIGSEKFEIGKRYVISFAPESNCTITKIGQSGSTGVILDENTVWKGELMAVAGQKYYFEFIATTTSLNYFSFNGAENINYSITFYYGENDNIGDLSLLNTENKDNIVSAINSVIGDGKDHSRIVDLEISALYQLPESVVHTSESGASNVRFNDLYNSGRDEREAIVEILSETDFTISSLTIENSAGTSIKKTIATNISITAGSPCRLGFSIPANSNVSYLGVHGGEAINYTVKLYSNLIGEQIYKLILDLQQGGSIVPDFYKSQLAEKSPIIQANMNGVGRHGESFVFVTDQHWNNNFQHSPALIGYVLDNSNVNIIICGGDVINDMSKQAAIELWVDYVHKMNFPKVPAFYCRGNHDGNYNVPSTIGSVPTQDPANKLDFNAVFALSQKQSSMLEEFATQTDMSFCFDRKDTKTRFIFLDGGDTGNFTDYVDADTRPMNYTSLKAFCEMLIATPAGYHIVAVPHAMKGRAYRDVENWSSTYIIGQIVDAYNSRGSFTLDGTTYDFSNGSAEIVCVMAGHEHQDRMTRTPNGMPVIITDTDSWLTHSESGATEGTITEQAFDVVTIDYVNEITRCVRIGRGGNRTVHYSPIISTENAVTLTTELSGTITWDSASTGYATVSGGIVTKVANGNSVITATDEDGNSEIWVVGFTS